MKKALICLLAALMILSGVLLVACNADVVAIAIEGAPESVKRGETIDYSAISIVVSYNDETQQKFKLTDDGVSYNEIDTSTTGNKTLTVTYKHASAQAVIRVEESQQFDDNLLVIAFDNARGYIEYQLAIKDKANKETEFYDKTVAYTVGTDNGYRFLPQITVDVEGEDVVLTDVNTEYTLYRLVNGSFVKVDDVSPWLSKVENNVYYFTQEAEGEVFRLDVTLGDRFEFIDDEMSRTVSQQFRVVSGYNVYDALGLSVLDNRNNESWKDIKSVQLPWDDKPLSGYGDVKQVILHNNITVTADNLPSNYFWQEGEPAKKEGGTSFNDANSNVQEHLRKYLVGSLKECYLGEEWEHEDDTEQRGLYVSNGIGLSGNYLRLSYDSGLGLDGIIPERGIYIVHDYKQTTGATRSYPESHYSFLCYTHAIEGLEEAGINGTRTIENVYFVGQTQKTDDNTLPVGLMMMTGDMANVRINNVIGLQWYCNATLDGVGVGTISIDKCKFYDSFSQMVFSWGLQRIDITGSEMKRAGGPLLILQTRTNDIDRETVVNIDDASNMESYLKGSEMWFQINNLPGEVVENLLAVATLPDAAHGTHFSNDEGMANLIAVVIPEPGDVFTNQHALHGTINVGNNSYGMADPFFNGLIGIGGVASAGATLTETTVTAMDALLDEGTRQSLSTLQVGFTTLAQSTAALPVAPIYKCGADYGIFDGKQLGGADAVVAGAAQLQAGAAQVQAVLQQAVQNLTALGDPYHNVEALTQLCEQWSELVAQLAVVGSHTGSADGSWSAGELAFWVNPGGLNASSPDMSLKHFMILLGAGSAE